MKKLKLLILATALLMSFVVRGQSWSTCGGGFFYPPKALFADTISNKLYASGFVTTVDGMQANSVASWDGTKWDTLAHGALGAYGEFLIRYQDKLYLQRNDNIYTWDFNALKWDSVPGGYVGGTINAAVIFNGDLIIAGYFNRIGNVMAHNIARFDGTNFYPIGAPTFSYFFNTVEIYNNEIYAGGNFNDTLYGGIAKWNGSQWVDLNQGVKGSNQEVRSLKTYHNRLYVGGSFYGTKDGYNPSLAIWDGIKWSNIGGIYYHNWPWAVVYKIHKWNDKLLVCGNFERAGDIDATSLALWNDTNWCSINTDTEGLVWVSAIFQNKLYVGEHETLNGDSVHLIGYMNGGYNIGTCGAAVGINELDVNNNLNIYPNPTSSTLNITDEQNQLQNSTIDVKNTLGQTVLSFPFKPEIDVSSLPIGVYFLQIKTEDKRLLNAKFIKD